MCFDVQQKKKKKGGGAEVVTAALPAPDVLTCTALPQAKQAPKKEAPKKEAPKAAAAEDVSAEQYFADHNIEGMLNDVVRKLAKECPADPSKWIGEQLMGAAQQLNGTQCLPCEKTICENGHPKWFNPAATAGVSLLCCLRCSAHTTPSKVLLYCKASHTDLVYFRAALETVDLYATTCSSPALPRISARAGS